jgi:membrane fusion protein, heavy metal efflux system
MDWCCAGRRRPGIPNLACRLAIIAVLVLFWTPTLAHEGHDLEPAPTAGVLRELPRLTASSENYELVGVIAGRRLTIYLDRFQDNTPVNDASIMVTINDESQAAESTEDGTYAVNSSLFEKGGLFEFVFDIRAPESDDLLIGKLTLAGSQPSGATQNSQPWYTQTAFYLRHGIEDHLMLLTLTLLAGLAMGIGLHWRHVRVVPVVVLVSGLGLVVAVGGARAQNGQDLQNASAVLLPPADTSGRLPDGKVFMPKATQRILDVRTVVAKTESVPKIVVLVGRVITDPNRSGLVQSINGGRVIPPEQGLPRMGQAVAKGDVLASIESPLPMADRTTISDRTGEIEQMIAVAEAKLRRLRSMAERGFAPQALIAETEAELEGLYRRREAVRDTRVAPEILRAPVDGVIATARVVAGQVVQAQDVLFQIVDPQSLWVEAYDYGDDDPATLQHATAVVGAYDAVKLDLRGWSRTLQQQATVLQFSIDKPPPSIRVGEPVTVTAQRGDSTNGIIIDREAVVRGGNGEMVVWRHVEPEYFEARPVRAEPFDAGRMFIAAGVAKGERIVIRGAELINQIR